MTRHVPPQHSCPALRGNTKVNDSMSQHHWLPGELACHEYYCERWPLNVEQALAGSVQGTVLHEHDAIRHFCKVSQRQQAVVILYNDFSALIRPA